MLRILALLLTLVLTFSLAASVFADNGWGSEEDQTSNEEQEDNDKEDERDDKEDEGNQSGWGDEEGWDEERPGPADRISITGSLSLDVGDTATINVTSGSAYDWRCSDWDIVELYSTGSGSCRVRALRAGSCTVTAESRSGYTDTCSIRVYGKSGSISLDKSTIYPDVGDKIRIYATTSPSSMDVSWKSSDTNIATVDNNGNVTAKKVGTCTITAYNNSYDVSKTCTVRVGAGANANDINYTVNSGSAVKFNATDFVNACSGRGSSLRSVKFTLPNSSQGILCYDFVNSTTYSSVSASTQYYPSGSSNALDRVYFYPSTGYTGRVAISYTGTDSNSDTFSGSVYVTVNAAPVVVPPTPTPAATTSKFSDVKEGEWYAAPVSWAVEKKIAEGKGGGIFAPTETCTHAHILTFLYRANGSPAVTGPSPFATAPASWYANAAIWAFEKGLVTDKNFNFNKDCTRADAVTYMWKAKGNPDMGNPNFTDVAASAGYAKAVAWAVQRGVTNGTSKDLFSPNETCTRGHIVTFLYRDYTKE